MLSKGSGMPLGTEFGWFSMPNCLRQLLRAQIATYRKPAACSEVLQIMKRGEKEKLYLCSRN